MPNTTVTGQWITPTTRDANSNRPAFQIPRASEDTNTFTSLHQPTSSTTPGPWQYRLRLVLFTIVLGALTAGIILLVSFVSGTSDPTFRFAGTLTNATFTNGTQLLDTSFSTWSLISTVRNPNNILTVTLNHINVSLSISSIPITNSSASPELTIPPHESVEIPMTLDSSALNTAIPGSELISISNEAMTLGEFRVDLT